MKLIDNVLNRISMYRVVLYGLVLMWFGALSLSLFNLQAFSALDLVLSTAFILAVCYFANYIFAWIYRAPSNYDSVYITAFILALIISPNNPLNNLYFLGWASAIAMASKYILAIRRKHLFNPAAVAVLITALFINHSASWWAANLYMMPIVLVFGYLIVRKVQRFDLVLGFIISALVFITVWGVMKGENALVYAWNSLIYSPIIFFSMVMLTEPLTMPGTKKKRIFYGVLTGFLFAPFIHLGPIYSTPEMALVIGDVFSYLISPKFKLILKFAGKRKVAENTYSFYFRTDQNFTFKPGQYFEWTVPHEDADAAGIRRYFTVASAPSNKEIEIGVRFSPAVSSLKRRLLELKPDEEIIASQLAGDFVLPADKSKRLVFIAGGIGITPFKSMIQYLIDNQEKRSITLFYSNRRPEDISYFNFLNEVSRDLKNELHINVIYALTDLETVPVNWAGERGRISAEIIKKNVPDYETCLYYLSGPTAVVSSFKKILLQMGVKKDQIKTDYFPGFV